MNRFAPVELETVLPRLASEHVRRVLGVSRVVVVMGARQTGKSTLIQTLPALQGIPYLTLDDLDVRDQARVAPEDLVRRAPRLILDEVQREEDLVLATSARWTSSGRACVVGSC